MTFKYQPPISRVSKATYNQIIKSGLGEKVEGGYRVCFPNRVVVIFQMIPDMPKSTGPKTHPFKKYL